MIFFQESMRSPSNIPSVEENQFIKSGLHSDVVEKTLLLFDIDSTLISVQPGVTRRVVAQTFEVVFGQSACIDQVSTFAGKTDLQIFFELGEASGIDQVKITNKWYDIIELMTRLSASAFHEGTITVLPRVAELLYSLSCDQRFVLGLVTGNNRHCAPLKLQPFSLDKYFTFGAYGCEHFLRSKLPPLAYERAQRQYPHYSFSLNRTIVIGDSPADVDCALKNNMQSIAVATGQFTQDELLLSGAHYVLENFEYYQNVTPIFLQWLYNV